MASFFKGTSLDQNIHFKDKEKKLMKSYQFPKIFDTQKINMQKVNIQAVESWIENKLAEIMP